MEINEVSEILAMLKTNPTWALREIFGLAQTEHELASKEICLIVKNKTYTDIDTGFKIERVQDNGGDEGGGEAVDWVYEISHKDLEIPVYVEFFGSYCSYNGIEWHDGCELVKPVQVLVTQYVLV